MDKSPSGRGTVSCVFSKLKFEQFLTYICFPFMLSYNLTQTDCSSIFNYFLNRKINVNWLKQQGSLLTHASTNLNDGANLSFLSTSLIVLILLHSGKTCRYPQKHMLKSSEGLCLCYSKKQTNK